VLKDIHALGVRLAVDDFGTGYSSLSYLRRMPIDEVKLDRSFFADANLQGNGIKIVESIIHLSHTLGLDVIAEGTETPDQVTLLQKCLCNSAQGYYFSEPVGEQDVLPLLRGEARLRHSLHELDPLQDELSSVTDP
jgi:EAL domain-containing protein (putative c-di-GMP-specific phosphodiesterase class I)